MASDKTPRGGTRQSNLLTMVFGIILVAVLSFCHFSPVVKVEETGGTTPTVEKAGPQFTAARENVPCRTLKPRELYSGREDQLEKDLVAFMNEDPQRFRFAEAMRCLCGTYQFLEIGTAHGRYTEFFAPTAKLWLVDPESGDFSDFRERLDKWNSNAPEKYPVTYHQGFSTDQAFIDSIPDNSLDFIYHDALHQYEALKKDMELFWPKLRVGGVYAGHDFCVHEGSKRLYPSWVGLCGVYQKGDRKGSPVKTQEPVVRAVLEMLPALGAAFVHRTEENFTEISAGKNVFDLALTSTRNPSWYFVKTARRPAHVCVAASLQPPWGSKEQTASTRHVCDHSQKFTTAMELTTTAPGCDHGKLHRPASSTAILTVGVLYFNDPSLIIKHVKDWMKWSFSLTQNVEFIIIDDGSAPALAAKHYIPRGTGLHISLFEITTQLDWNIGGARNLLFSQARTQHVINLDADTVLKEQSLERALEIARNEIKQGTDSLFNLREFTREATQKYHPGVFLMTKTLYWQAGGCDEDFVGSYGCTDVHFRYRVKSHPRYSSVYDDGLRIIDVNPGSKCILVDEVDLPRCTEAANGLVRIERRREVNKALYYEKRTTNCWSNAYLRFEWKETTVH